MTPSNVYFIDSGVVNQLVFSAGMDWDEKQITLDHGAGFISVVLIACIYNGAEFISGGLADVFGFFQSAPQNLGDGTWNGGD